MVTRDSIDIIIVNASLELSNDTITQKRLGMTIVLSVEPVCRSAKKLQYGLG